MELQIWDFTRQFYWSQTKEKAAMQTGWARQVGFLLESLSCILPAQQLFPIHFTPFLIPPNSLPGQGKRDPKPPPGEPCPELVSPFCSIHSPFLSLSFCLLPASSLASKCWGNTGLGDFSVLSQPKWFHDFPQQAPSGHCLLLTCSGAWWSLSQKSQQINIKGR